MARKVAIVGLVLLIVLVAIPLGIGAAMSGCPECPAVGTSQALGLCLTLQATIILVVALGLMGVGTPSTQKHALLLSRTLERPPRIV